MLACRDFLQFLTVPPARSADSSSAVGSNGSGGEAVQPTSLESIDAQNRHGVYADSNLHFDVPFLSIVRSTHYLNKAQTTLDAFAATRPLSPEVSHAYRIRKCLVVFTHHSHLII